MKDERKTDDLREPNAGGKNAPTARGERALK
jgi:hypothetical protein